MKTTFRYQGEASSPGSKTPYSFESHFTIDNTVLLLHETYRSRLSVFGVASTPNLWSVCSAFGSGQWHGRFK